MSEATYDIGEGRIHCRICGLQSWNPYDIEKRYCGYCNVFHDDLYIGVDLVRRGLAALTPNMQERDRVRLLNMWLMLIRTGRRSEGAAK